ncbi:GAF domain-containing protein [Caloramator quimbayensis]|uniref:GAF domain-containing protein n=1 Tax=Caloramator quimbayensis TaxID=1147123 RepID=A0A1T4WT17_9CLOT|nr:GAF domain-containing protein [Caloramator quimbayensis]SKA79751.1 GAF domain-containing protein [Caloramator quimbayensis]
MENLGKIKADTKESFYDMLLPALEGLISSEEDSLANICNTASLLYNNLDDINWAGFYIMKDGELVLGPFGGKIACVRIKVGRGVCGSAVRDKKTYVVPNVHEFEGHIACDSASNSEIVVPIIKDGILYGVLDIDSPIFNRFDEVDKIYLEKAVEVMNKYIKWEEIARV